jgi:hypothetical protein
MKKATITALIVSLITIFTLGCGTIHRLDGGKSAEFNATNTNATEVIVGAIQIGGSVFSLYPWQKRTGLVRTADQPSIAAANAIASKAAAEAMNGQVIHTNGNKIIIFGAQGVNFEAQDLKLILEQLNKLSPAGQIDPAD